MRTLLMLCLLVLLSLACRADAPADEATALGWLPPDLDCVGALRPSLLPADVSDPRSRAPALLCPLLLVEGLDQRARMRAVAFGAKGREQCCIVVGDASLTYEALHTLGQFPPEKGRPVLHASPRPGIVMMSTDAGMLRDMEALVDRERRGRVPDLVRPSACGWVVEGARHVQMVATGPQTWQILVDPATCSEPELKSLAKVTTSGDLCLDHVSGEPAVVITGLLASKLLGYPFDLPNVPAPR